MHFSNKQVQEFTHASPLREKTRYWRNRLPLLGILLAVGGISAACTPMVGPVTTTSTTIPSTTPEQPNILTFATSGNVGSSPALVTFSWTASDANGDPLTCKIDGNGDGTDDVTIRNCEFGGSRNVSVTLDDPAVAQTFTARLIVEDANTPAVVQTTDFDVQPGTTELFNITLRGASSLPTAALPAFNGAAARWEQILTAGVEDFGEVPTSCIPEGTEPIASVDDIVIDVSVVPIDGVNGILGQAGPTCISLSTELGLHGTIQFDSADVTALLANGTFSSVVLHEMAHVLGFGTLWNTTSIGGTRNVTQGQGTGNPRFTGVRAVAEWSRLGGLSGVPLENTGGAGTVGSHWKESTFGNELMTGYISPSTNPLSRLSIAQFADLGYNVDISKADSYSVPGFGLLRSAMQQDAPIEGVMLAPPINSTP